MGEKLRPNKKGGYKPAQAVKVEKRGRGETAEEGPPVLRCSRAATFHSGNSRRCAPDGFQLETIRKTKL